MAWRRVLYYYLMLKFELNTQQTLACVIFLHMNTCTQVRG